MHNNETHLLICTVPWSHVTMKWMAVFFVVCFFCMDAVYRMWKQPCR